MALSTIDIDRYLSKYDQFKGVYAIDLLPRYILQKPAGIVINLDPSWLTGSHWTALFIPEYGPSIYFDSFGNRPPETVLSFSKRHNKNYGLTYNSNIYQGDLSIKCGYYCILFLEACFSKTEFPLLICNTKFNEFIINNFY